MSKLQIEKGIRSLKTLQQGWFDESEYKNDIAFDPIFLDKLQLVIIPFVEKIVHLGWFHLGPYLDGTVDLHFPHWLLINFRPNWIASCSLDYKGGTFIKQGPIEEILQEILDKLEIKYEKL